MNNLFRDNGGKLPAGLDYFHNLLSPPGPFMRLLKRKRQPIVKVRRNDVSIDGTLTVKSWKWECRICKQTWWSLNWWTTQNSATRHTHTTTTESKTMSNDDDRMKLPDWIYPMIVDNRGDLYDRIFHPAFFKAPELPKELFDKANCHDGKAPR